MFKHFRYAMSLNVEFILALTLVVFTSISIRLAEFAHWQNESLLINGEPLMATHDAYTWLAGAKGVGNYVNHAFTRILALSGSLSGVPLAEVGFWAPIVFVPLLAIPVCLLARRLRLPEGGLVFGILAASGLGYLVRTRLGFADTDVLSLLFPVAMASVLTVWIDVLSGGRDGSVPVTPTEGMPSLSTIWWPLAAGLMGKFAILVYPSNKSIILALYAMAALLGLLRVSRDTRVFFWSGLILMFGVSFGNWLAISLAGAWALACQRGSLWLKERYLVAGMIGITAAVLYLSNVYGIVWLAVERMLFYAKASATDMKNATTVLKLPDVAQSVREAQNLDWSLLGPRLGGNWVIFTLGVVGFGLVSWKRSALLVFLPFLLLGLASLKLGNRFAMYGTVAVGLGMGLGLSELMRMLNQSQGRRWIAQLIMACLALWPSAQFMAEARPVPVLPKIYAQTFLDLKDVAEPDALLWMWWDYGYAAQYYAERATFSDGGRQIGPWLYPLARVHCADSPRQAVQLIRYFGQAMFEDGAKKKADVKGALFAGNPVDELLAMDTDQARRFLSILVADSQNWKTSVPNYFVVSWENLRLASWISYYGNWDIFSGDSSPGKIQQVRGEVRFDLEAGLMLVNGKSTSVDSLDVVKVEGGRNYQWPRGTGFHVVINEMSRQVFLMNATMYRSMMVQMLLRPASNFSAEFSLVVDNYPWVRAYKVKQ